MDSVSNTPARKMRYANELRSDFHSFNICRGLANKDNNVAAQDLIR
jgi:hypothetical protein